MRLREIIAFIRINFCFVHFLKQSFSKLHSNLSDYRIHVAFVVGKFREITENPMNENFRDKKFVIATFFRDYHRTAAPVRTIHIVAPPTIARGSHFARMLV